MYILRVFCFFLNLTAKGRTIAQFGTIDESNEPKGQGQFIHSFAERVNSLSVVTDSNLLNDLSGDPNPLFEEASLQGFQVKDLNLKSLNSNSQEKPHITEEKEVSQIPLKSETGFALPTDQVASFVLGSSKQILSSSEGVRVNISDIQENELEPQNVNQKQSSSASLVLNSSDNQKEKVLADPSKNNVNVPLLTSELSQNADPNKQAPEPFLATLKPFAVDPLNSEEEIQNRNNAAVRDQNITEPKFSTEALEDLNEKVTRKIQEPNQQISDYPEQVTESLATTLPINTENFQVVLVDPIKIPTSDSQNVRVGIVDENDQQTANITSQSIELIPDASEISVQKYEEPLYPPSASNPYRPTTESQFTLISIDNTQINDLSDQGNIITSDEPSLSLIHI